MPVAQHCFVSEFIMVAFIHFRDTMEDKEDMFELEVDGKPEINSER